MPMNKHGVIAAFALVLASWGNTAMSQERINGGTDYNPGFQGGWVIEVGEEEPMQGEINVQADQPVQPQAVGPVHHGGAGIEMIIGGQGDGGVAKRGTLPIVD